MHKVYVYFFLNRGWQIQFLQADLKTPLSCKLTFESADKVRELLERGNALKTCEDRSGLEHGIEVGSGGAYLMLTEAQYKALLTTD